MREERGGEGRERGGEREREREGEREGGGGGEWREKGETDYGSHRMCGNLDTRFVALTIVLLIPECLGPAMDPLIPPVVSPLRTHTGL